MVGIAHRPPMNVARNVSEMNSLLLRSRRVAVLPAMRLVTKRLRDGRSWWAGCANDCVEDRRCRVQSAASCP
jgi:hypothetical protein